MEANSVATQSHLLQNTATITKFSYIFSTYRPDSCQYSIIFFLISSIWLNTMYTADQDNTLKTAAQRERKEGNTANINL